MRNILFAVVVVNLFCAYKAKAQSEISLYDSKGNAMAYIATDDDNTIYLWQGKPVAYLYNDGGTDTHIYNFAGKHLGWYVNGIIRDHSGNVIGFIKGAVTNVYLKYEEYKGYREYKPYQEYREYAPYKPYWSSNFGTTPLSLFLQVAGGNDNAPVQKRIYSSPDPIMETDLILLERVVTQKQTQFDKNTKSVQDKINSIFYSIQELRNDDSSYAASLLNSLRKYVNNLGSQSINYSDINSYNQVMSGLNRYSLAINNVNLGINRLTIIDNKLGECSDLVDVLIGIDWRLKDDVYKDFNSLVNVLQKGYTYFQNKSSFDSTSKQVSNLKQRLISATNLAKENKIVYWTHSGTTLFVGGGRLDELLKTLREKNKPN